MKKFVLNLTLIALLATTLSAYAEPVTNAEIKAAIRKYKAKDYIGCLQDTQAMVKKDPSSAVAYYYQGLAYTQLGKKSEATEAYNKVISLNGNSILTQNATKGISCLNGDDECMPKEEAKSELDEFIKSNKFYGNSVQAELNKKKLNQMKDSFNTNQKSEMPTNDEIAEAVKTLAKIGINPLAGMNGMNAAGGAAVPPQSAEMMQMNMLLGNNTNNNGMQNMLPMLLMNQGNGKNISPELIQTMMMSNMASDFNYGSQTY